MHKQKYTLKARKASHFSLLSKPALHFGLSLLSPPEVPASVCSSPSAANVCIQLEWENESCSKFYSMFTF